VLAQKFLEAVEQLNRDLGIPTCLQALKEADIPELAKPPVTRPTPATRCRAT
jgi:alcohol dehydrogenase class IV